jgi:hypothetical protein
MLNKGSWRRAGVNRWHNARPMCVEFAAVRGDEAGSAAKIRTMMVA